MSHILIIDDDIHINEMLEEVLIQEGYQVSHAYSGTEALLFLANEKPDLILLDLMLPGLTGEEVLSQIEKIPVIVRITLQNRLKLKNCWQGLLCSSGKVQDQILRKN